MNMGELTGQRRLKTPSQTQANNAPSRPILRPLNKRSSGLDSLLTELVSEGSSAPQFVPTDTPTPTKPSATAEATATTDAAVEGPSASLVWVRRAALGLFGAVSLFAAYKGLSGGSAAAPQGAAAPPPANNYEAFIQGIEGEYL